MKGIITTLRVILKYSAYILVIVEIVEFAITKIEGLQKKEIEKKPEDVKVVEL